MEVNKWPITTFEVAYVLNPYSLYSIGYAYRNHGGGSLANLQQATWPGANLALFIPFYLPERTTFLLAWWRNGDTIGNNVDVAVYDEDYNRLYSIGSTAQVGTVTNQTVVINWTLGPGRFYLAMSQDDTTGKIYRCTTTAAITTMRCTGLCEQAAAFPLPNPMAPTALTTNYLPIVGLSTRNFL